jgi:hypothetical protein
MRLSGRESRLAVSSLVLLGLAGCAEDNEAAIRQQAARAKGTIPGSRTAQAQDLAEYYEITPGLSGAGARGGPRPDQGAGYPEAKSAAGAGALWRMARPRTDQRTSPASVKR